MKSINKEKLAEIVKSLMLEPSDNVLEQILSEWDLIQKQMSFINAIDTIGIKPLSHIDEHPRIDFLREDTIDSSWAISKQTALQNALEYDQDYIITEKVVK
ncbi:glutamyl-tRNA amidotransferase subunit C [Mycoplasmopsis californica HAZ160_1]|uniref:Glutamyl-tRNA amidotransferase subunit C n=1 Tax=Mycoplasmopsis californica HAZ160_1 TaxID=1397850 RepID=A0AAT9F7G6_9BACT|nr:aspartyl/glutamyl-tRNA amidotransferase subunit C [Mycoplasmopsis californica]BAP00835.1 glutamyl-tRNA amidotransferase subunit C [Mycoplasmopsis californica HAZ160_1]BBG40691.1 glutamyl-tRNA amidotransferase subunit C [Mycoplasmopsis californica]BBG41285.1 glutamyl-tRNA amidotransferase subunit C [Mycoplasmopsis californica]BBG41878.1 glutamyl-tRNA amidotransferase subunit C [Mycoplasmopsis californica]BBG42471.1 glutamyl-tRNA amidotransferase subunit C [Mycoplasmopsis californica]